MNSQRFSFSSSSPLSISLYSLCIYNFNNSCKQVQRDFHLPAGDFPDVEHYREVLNGYSIDKFEKLKPKMIQAVDDMLAYEIPELLKNFKNPYE